jgi:hypothetical protein
MVKNKKYNKVEYNLYRAFKMSLADHKGKLDLQFHDDKIIMCFDDSSMYTFVYDDDSLGTYLADCYLPEKRVERLTMPIPTKTNNDILNDLSYKIWNLKNKDTVNNLCKSIGNETEINNIIDSLYKLKDILNNIHEEK